MLLPTVFFVVAISLCTLGTAMANGPLGIGFAVISGLFGIEYGLQLLRHWRTPR
jgi:hypothetical protein